MNTFLNSALALAVASSLGLAGTSSSSDWASMDKDLSLAATLGKGAAGGPEIGALLRSSLDFSSDDGYTIDTTGSSSSSEDLMGVRFQDATLFAQSQLGDYWWRISFDFATGGGAVGIPSNSGFDGLVGVGILEDAYARWNCSENFNLTMGQYKAPISRSNSLSAGRLLFIDRTLIGQAFDDFHPGLMARGGYESFNWDVSLQNGVDGASEDYALSARGEFSWNGGAGNMEGGYGMGDGNRGSVGVGYYKDNDDSEDGQVIVVDGSVSFSRFTIAAEIADYDEDASTTAHGLSYGDFTDSSGPISATPWAVTGSFMIRDDELEVALRYQDADDDDSSTVISGGLNWYKGGHNAKWQFNISDYSEDDSEDEGTLFQIGLCLGADS